GTACFARLRGMWGLVLVDGLRRRAILSRDRLGIKPLYLFRRPGLFAVVSEIKQLRVINGVELRPRRDSVHAYLYSGYEDAFRTFYDDVVPLAAGTWMEVDLDDGAETEPRSFWHPERVAVE